MFNAKTHHQILQLDECTWRADNRNFRFICSAIEQLPCKHCGRLVTVPELAYIPVLSEGIHGQLPFEVIFGL